jgi:protein TonB
MKTQQQNKKGKVLKARKAQERPVEMSGAMALRMTAAMPSSSERNFAIALGLSLALHAVLLSLHFKYPDASRAFQEKALDIILVNAKSARKPNDAQALAQANLDGGGNSEQDRRVKTPLPPSNRQQAGNDLEQAQKRVRTLEARQKQLIAQAKGKPKAAVKESAEVEAPPVAEVEPSGLDLVSKSLQMARLEGEIARQTEEYNKRPRVGRLTSARVREYRFARYVDDWRQKVERIGTLNYPEAARGKIYGNLVLTVRIRKDGSVERIEIDRSSGSRVLDDAARRVVRMAEPFANFPPDIARDFDILEITRTWTFTKGSQVATTN